MDLVVRNVLIICIGEDTGLVDVDSSNGSNLHAVAVDVSSRQFSRVCADSRQRLHRFLDQTFARACFRLAIKPAIPKPLQNS
jgi:hypothetical protein